MAVQVIYLLKIIQIKKQYCQLGIVPLGKRNLAIEGLFKIPAVKKTGQRVVA